MGQVVIGKFLFVLIMHHKNYKPHSIYSMIPTYHGQLFELKAAAQGRNRNLSLYQNIMIKNLELDIEVTADCISHGRPIV